LTRVLVTGGLGFIGSFTIDTLVERGYKVRCLDNLERQVHHGKIPAHRNRSAEYLHGDVRYRSSWAKAVMNVDYIIHLAAAVGVGQSFWQARKYVDTNVGGTATLFEYLLREKKLAKNVRKIIVASSKSIYGEGSYQCNAHGIIHPSARTIEELKQGDWEVRCPECGGVLSPVGIREDKPLQNLSPYALSKYAAESLAMNYTSVVEIPTVAFRYFNVYGPRQSLSNPYTGVVAILLSRIKNGNQPVVFEDGKQLRDYVYVEDVARLNADALENDAQGVFNVGTGKPHSLLQLIDSLKEILGSDIVPKVTQEYRPGDNRHDFADNFKLTSAFDFRHFSRLKDGLERLVEWAGTAKAVDLFEREERERSAYLVSSR
jgi:dTDP-L-rhamnose 4-epimerase